MRRVWVGFGGGTKNRQAEAEDHQVFPLAPVIMRRQAPSMFCVSDTEATAIRTVYDQDGELSAAVELRRFFPGVPRDKARFWARVIAGWQELEVKPLPVARRRLSVW